MVFHCIFLGKTAIIKYIKTGHKGLFSHYNLTEFAYFSHTLQSIHGYCRTFKAAELQKHKFNIPALAGTERLLYPLRKLKVHEKTTTGSCKFCRYKHPFTRPPRCSPLGEKMPEM